MGIVVIGAVFVDIKGYPEANFIPSGRNAGRVEHVHGGVARNVAEDIANCELRPTFVSLVDQSGTGMDVVRKLKDHKVNTQYIRTTHDGMGTWLAVFDNDGDVVASISKRPNLLPIGDILLPGVHNIENYMAAIAAVEGLVSDETVKQVAKTFGGVEHRIELVRVKDGVRFYNDSIASSPSRTIAGLRSFPEKVILIAGGYDKQIPYDVLGPEICDHVKILVLGGVTGPKIRQAVEQAAEYVPGCPEIVDCGEFTAAVHTAAKLAKPGDVVLMSPASAAFDQFKNFMVRGEYFKKLVMEL